ncbi:lactate dehydrogenase-like 2-hydroxyacid dehydrogenase [Herbaspirillum sp. Sphag1AN]|uniref:2-hydroxyacid dehydrogenase n=1 Tax=unclassified Herbaspirillum TaxID=2624150 RepID=UPI00161E8BCE|nr:MULTISPECIES: 2-hydroxyacid dehydrogenase [unclassified Herbaspirillum]MBB3211067.1 lactate dehydrogenase-like 2-hydroxyacid dehydrogenase [Herbaspirillum sp. Sphag1AN]MBB3244696.1 lactate dehydrogenase-like 2-hydroxyacid dehydrogenase [Herbaspirillum sp. Sphag64]
MPPAPELLILIPLAESLLAQLRDNPALPTLRYAPQGPDWSDSSLQAIRFVLTNGSTGLSRQQIQALPALKLVSAFGAGYEGIDLQAAYDYDVAVTHAPGANNATVADHAMALMLAIARGLHVLDGAVKAGQWELSRAARPSIHGKRLGIIGLGNIGLQIARRATAFDMEVAYHTRHVRPELPYDYCATPLALATRSDYLILACPGGPATRHLVNRDLLTALGPQGFLINIARGSVVDTAALIEALQHKRIAGAALDAVDGEPILPAAFSTLDNLLLTPHISGRSPEALQVQLGMFCDNLLACQNGQALQHLITQ